MKQLSERNKGIICILMAAFFFSLMSLLIRLAGDLPTMEKALFRNLVATVVSWGMLIKSHEKIKIEAKNMPALLMRAGCGTVALVCNFYAVDHLNISDANMLNKLSPFFAMLMSIVLLKEKVSGMEWATVIMAFAGALLVIKPGFSMNAFPAFIGFLGGMGAGIAYAFLRKLGKNGVSGSVIVMFFSTFSTVVLFPFFIMNYEPMTFKQLLILIGTGLAATGGQLSITAAYTHAPAKEISIYDYTQILFAAVWGFIFFGQIPDWMSLTGYVVIISAAVLKFRLGKNTDETSEKTEN